MLHTHLIAFLIFYIQITNGIVICVNITRECDVATSAKPFPDGSGTQDDPFLICSTTQFNSIGNNCTGGKYYMLGKDLNFSGAMPNPIGSKQSMFDGNWNGNGYKIVNYVINGGSGQDVGLFGRTAGANIYNMGFSPNNVCSSPNTFFEYAGGLVGHAGPRADGRRLIQTNITNMIIDVSVNAAGGYCRQSGGLVGQLNQSIVSNIVVTKGRLNVGFSNKMMGLLFADVKDSSITGTIVVGDAYGTESLKSMQSSANNVAIMFGVISGSQVTDVVLVSKAFMPTFGSDGFGIPRGVGLIAGQTGRSNTFTNIKIIGGLYVGGAKYPIKFGTVNSMIGSVIGLANSPNQYTDVVVY